MEFFKPDFRLLKLKENDNFNNYLLHAITHSDKVIYQADGFIPLAEQVDENGLYHVNLLVSKNDLPDISYVTPIVHTLIIPTEYLEHGNGEIKVSIRYNNDSKGETIIVTADADETIRPIMENIIPNN